MMERVLSVGHSPDADDAFMFYALTHDKIDTGSYRFEHKLRGIDVLNQCCMRDELDVSAVSVHACAYLTDRYAVMPVGASMGKGYGPILVSQSPLVPADLQGGIVGVPGTLTTAFLLMQLWLQRQGSTDSASFLHRELPFDEIMEAVRRGDVAAGLLIHEGQLTYKDFGLHQIVDLGDWWLKETGLPTPLGMNVIRKDLGAEVITDVCRLLRESVDYALENREEALAYALEYSRGLDTERADQFVGMYVNDYTREIGEEGRAAIDALLTRAHVGGVLESQAILDWAE